MGIKRFTETAKVLKHTIEKFVQMTAEVWKDFNQEARLYNSSGEDSVPCKDDQLILVKIDGTGKYIAAGVLTVSQGAAPGEKILYARDADAKIVSKISMLGDGSIEINTDQADTKKGDFTKTIKGNETETIKGDSKKNVDGKSSETIKGDKVIDSGGKVYIGGAADNICALLLALVDELIDFQTFGPPPQHKTHPQTIIKLKAYKEKIKALFMESHNGIK